MPRSRNVCRWRTRPLPASEAARGRYWLSFVDLYRDPILWSQIERGVALQAVYVVVLLTAAWANFATRDITS